MEESDIRRLVAALDTDDASKAEEVWGRLKPLGPKVLPYFLEAFPKTKKWKGRVHLVFHSVRFARTHPEAFQLGILGLSDKATLVRYRACGSLAYSLRKDALPHLEKLLGHPDKKTAEDAKAAIDAIKNKNHHYFIDRGHTDRSFWEVNEGDRKGP
jgi:hypothetical protein